jgi:hypothetical protein
MIVIGGIVDIGWHWRLTAAPAAVLAEANNAYAQAKQTTPEKSLYERLGGVFAIAAVVVCTENLNPNIVVMKPAKNWV